MTKIRRFIILVALGLMTSTTPVNAQEPDEPQYQIAACDWMMLKRQKIGEFALAKQVGADGVEMDMGALGNRKLFDNQLRDSAQAAKFRHLADSLGIKIPSIAMSGFFAQSLLKRDNYQELFEDCLRTMRFFQCRVAFLPLGGSGQGWKTAGPERNELIHRLRVLGERAQEAGVIIGIRTALDAKANKKLLKAIGSKGIAIYYNFQDATDNGRDIAKELKSLGRKRIIQIHATNTDGVLLENDQSIDLHKIKQTLDRMKWKGWLVVERSRDKTRVRDVSYNFSHNIHYLKKIFQTTD